MSETITSHSYVTQQDIKAFVFCGRIAYIKATIGDHREVTATALPVIREVEEFLVQCDTDMKLISDRLSRLSANIKHSKARTAEYLRDTEGFRAVLKSMTYTIPEYTPLAHDDASQIEDAPLVEGDELPEYIPSNINVYSKLLELFVWIKAFFGF